MIRRDYHPASFRDPAGKVFFDEKFFYREVNQGAISFVRDLLEKRKKNPNSLWVKSLVKSELREESTAPYLQHERIDLVSYSYEWSPEQLRDAALFTLELQIDLLKHDLSLKDATPFNIAFDGVRPVFVDFHSIEPYSKDTAWVAWNDFQEFFTYPLLVYSCTGFYLMPYLAPKLGRCSIEVAKKIIASKNLLSWSLLKYLRLPYWAYKASNKNSLSTNARGASLKKSLLIANLEDLKSTLSSLNFVGNLSHWKDYQNCCHYSEADQQSKKEFVSLVASKLASQHQHAVDIGANTGEYTSIIEDSFKKVLSIESDVEACSQLYLRAKNDSWKVTPVLADFASPTPALGWAACERASFFERFKDARLTLALAVIHHLRISSGIPFELMIAEFKKLSESILLEWVPIEDPMSQKLLSGRSVSLYADYNLKSFESLLSQNFLVREKKELTNRRILYWLDRKTT